MPDFRIETYRILNVTEASEYQALSAANKDFYKIIISAGIVNLAPGAIVRETLWSMFDEESVTGQALRDPDNRFVLIPAVEE